MIVKEFNLPSEEAIQFLKQNVSISFWHKHFWGPAFEEKLYGSFGKKYFKIDYYSGFRNSFTPIFYGKILPTEKGCQIRGFFGIDIFVFLLLIIWNSVFILKGPHWWVFNLFCVLLVYAGWLWGKKGQIKILNLLDRISTIEENCTKNLEASQD